MSRIDARANDLETVREILRKHVPTRRVVAFGSRATGRSKPFSDLDLAIQGDAEVPSAILAALADDFDESSLPLQGRHRRLGDDGAVVSGHHRPRCGDVAGGVDGSAGQLERSS